MRLLPLLLLFSALNLSATPDKTDAVAAPDQSDPPKQLEPQPNQPPADDAGLEAALARLQLPGIKINVAEWCVDVDARVALDQGMLEVIACTPDTKEHESILIVDAKPSHIHTALLLLGARPGNPAMMKVIQPEGDPDAQPRILHLPPKGDKVDAFLVFGENHPKQHPIHEFIVKAAQDEFGGPAGDAPADEKPERFPDNTFLFTGSILDSAGEGPPSYLADHSGHVITLSTFGDELLGLSDIHAHANEALVWEVDGTNLPAPDSKLILRLRPHRAPAAP